MPLKRYEKDKILESCFNIFVDNGYSKTTTAMLAEAAGISKALIFHHFKNKKRVYFEVLQKCFEDMAPEINHSEERHFIDFFDAKEQLGLIKIDYFKKKPKVSKLLFEALYKTPEELKSDMDDFKMGLKAKYGNENRKKEEELIKLFKQIPFKKGINPLEAYDLINIISDHFRVKLAEQSNDVDKLPDDKYLKDFMAKKKRYINMIRFGIQKGLKDE